MRQVSTDQNGQNWDICWGIQDEKTVLEDVFNLAGPFQRTEGAVSFQAPLYQDETKTLGVYEAANGCIVAMGEITSSVYAAGVKL